MYDQKFADERKRRVIEKRKRGSCVHCEALGISTASDYEWPCLILRDWICETHCTEIQVLDYPDTRKSIAVKINWRNSSDRLLDICKLCPYRNLSDPQIETFLKRK